jgi:hypothetical protein
MAYYVKVVTAKVAKMTPGLVDAGLEAAARKPNKSPFRTTASINAATARRRLGEGNGASRTRA